MRGKTTEIIRIIEITRTMEITKINGMVNEVSTMKTKNKMIKDPMKYQIQIPKKQTLLS
jgi:hypothetical protein